MSSLLARLVQDECRRICSQCLLQHSIRRKTPVRELHRSRLRYHATKTGSESLSRRKLTWKRKFVYSFGFGTTCLGVYYMSLDEPNKRKIRVVIGGVGRFLRFVQEIPFLICANRKSIIFLLEKASNKNHNIGWVSVGLLKLNMYMLFV